MSHPPEIDLQRQTPINVKRRRGGAGGGVQGDGMSGRRLPESQGGGVRGGEVAQADQASRGCFVSLRPFPLRFSAESMATAMSAQQAAVASALKAIAGKSSAPAQSSTALSLSGPSSAVSGAAAGATKAAESSMTALEFLGVVDPCLKAVKEVAYRTSSTTLGNVMPGIGFRKVAMEITVDRNWFATWRDLGTAMRATINFEWKSMPAPILTPLRRMAEQFATGGQLQKEFAKIFVGDKDLNGLYVAVGPGKLWDGSPAKEFTWSIVGGQWAKAADYIVVTHSESDFWGSSTDTYLQRMPADNKGVTPKDVQNLMAMLSTVHDRFLTLTKRP